MSPFAQRGGMRFITISLIIASPQHFGEKLESSIPCHTACYLGIGDFLLYRVFPEML